MKNKSTKPDQKIKPILSTHCLGTIISKQPSKLFNGQACLDAITDILRKTDTVQLGELLHVFPNKSFTLVVVLAESHISIHTWPERLAIQLDVFLCNYKSDNSATCEQIFDEISEYFGPVEIDKSLLERL